MRKAVAQKLFIFCIVFLILIGFTVHAHASFTPTINYQGKLTSTSSEAVPDGTYNMVFKLYTVATGGSPIWTENDTSTHKVQVTNGLFSIMLGSTTSLTGVNFNQPLYLGVTIGSDSEMTPRKPLGTVPAAFIANHALNASTSDNATTFDNLATTSFLRSDQADTATGLLTFSGGFISHSSSTIANLSVLTATTTTLSLNGKLYDASHTAGTNGYILQTTGAGTHWVATSTLGITGVTTFLGLSDTPSSYTTGRLLYESGSGVTDASSLTFANSKLTAPVFNASGASTTLITIGTDKILQATTSYNSFSLALGYHAGDISNPLAGENTAIGVQALMELSSGHSNTALGFAALESNTSGYQNTVVGMKAALNTTGYDNVAVGNESLFQNTNGNENTFVGSNGDASGFDSGYRAINGNAVLGFQAGLGLGLSGTSNYNTFLGYDAAGNLQSGSNNIIIGSYVFAPNSAGSQQLNIGNLLYGTGIYDGSSYGSSAPVSGGKIGIGTTTPSQKLTVAGNGWFGGNVTATGSLAIAGAATLSSTLNVTGKTTLANASTTNLSLAGKFFDVTNSAGTKGKVLQTTGTSTRWVATSSLGISGGIAAVIDDTSPQLGGNLDLNGKDITDSSDTLNIGDEVDDQILLKGNVTLFGTYLDTNSRYITDTAAHNVKIGDGSSDSISLRGDTYLWGPTGLDLNGREITDTFNHVLLLGNGSSDKIALRGNVGIGTTTPSQALTVAGNLRLTGALYDSTNSAGSNGYVLQSTATGQKWVATSTLGIGGAPSLFTEVGTTTYLTAIGDTLAIGTTTTQSAANNQSKVTLIGNNPGTKTYFSSLHVSGTQTAAGAFGYYGITTDPTYTGTGASSLLMGLNSSPVVKSGTVSTYTGIWANPSVAAGAKSTNTMGIYTSPQNTGTTTSLYGIYSTPTQVNLNPTSVTSIYGFYNRVSGGNGAPNNYGIYLDTPLTGTFTNNYGIYQKDAAAKNYFAGNVGVGTSTPDSLLTVAGTTTIESNDQAYNWVTGNKPATAQARIGGNDQGNGLIISQANGGASGTLLGIYDQYGTSIFTVTPSGVAVGGSNRVSFNAGITSGPALNLSGDNDYAVLNSTDDTKPAAVIVDNTDLSVERTTPLLRFAGATSNNPSIGDSTGGINAVNDGTNRGLAFDSYNGTSFIENMRLLSNGDIGIGTTTPTQKLTVAGSIRATGALYGSNNSAGSNGYVLKSTGTGFQWVATSTLGIGGGASTFLGLSDTPSTYNSGRLLYESGSAVTDSSSLTFASSILKIPSLRATASSTIGGGTATTGLTVSGDATTTGDMHVSGPSLVVGPNVDPLYDIGDAGVYLGGENYFYRDGTTAWLNGVTLNITSSNGGNGLNLIPGQGDPGKGVNIEVPDGTIAQFDFDGVTFTSQDGNDTKMRYDYYGNLGIGTTTPSSKLDVWGNLRVGTSSTPLLLANTGSGQVSIGTTTNSTLGVALNVDGGVYLSSGEDNGLLFGDTTNGQIYYDGTGLNISSNVPMNINSDTSLLTINGGALEMHGNDHFTIDSGIIKFSNYGTQEMILDGSGNLGIGTTTPTQKLTVSGNALVSGSLTTDAITATGISSSGTINFSGLTANRLVTTDGSKNLVSTITSANLAASISDETGTGKAVFATSPTLTTPNLGTPSTLVGTNITGTGASFTAGHVTTNANLTGAVTSSGNTTSLGSFTSANLATALTDETGSGSVVFSASPTLTGTLTAAAANFSGDVGIGGGTAYQLLNLSGGSTQDVGISFVAGTSSSASSGPNYTGTVANDTSSPLSSGQAWTNPTNAEADDSTYASISGASPSAQSQYLKATNFGFSIPAGSTITGISVSVDRGGIGDPSETDTYAQIVKGGTIKTGNKATGTSIPNPYAVITYGGSSDLWGQTWTAADINDSGFGFAYGAQDDDHYVDVDYISITVYYINASGQAQWAIGTPNGSSDFTIAQGTSLGSNRYLTIDGSGNVGVGTTTPKSKFDIWGSLRVGTSSIPTLIANALSGFVGIGVADPDKKLEVYNTVSDSQFKISYDASRYANFQVDSTGGLLINPSGQTVTIPDGNLSVCESGSCPSITASSTGGYMTVENGVYFGNGFKIDQVAGTTTQLGVYNASGTPIILFDQ